MKQEIYFKRKEESKTMCLMLVICLFFLSTSFVSSETFGYGRTETTPINYSKIPTVNNSQYLQSLTPQQVANLFDSSGLYPYSNPFGFYNSSSLDLGGYVPYIGASQNLNLGLFNLIANNLNISWKGWFGDRLFINGLGEDNVINETIIMFDDGYGTLIANTQFSPIVDGSATFECSSGTATDIGGGEIQNEASDTIGFFDYSIGSYWDNVAGVDNLTMISYSYTDTVLTINQGDVSVNGTYYGNKILLDSEVLSGTKLEVIGLDGTADSPDGENGAYIVGGNGINGIWNGQGGIVQIVGGNSAPQTDDSSTDSEAGGVYVSGGNGADSLGLSVSISNGNLGGEFMMGSGQGGDVSSSVSGLGTRVTGGGAGNAQVGTGNGGTATSTGNPQFVDGGNAGQFVLGTGDGGAISVVSSSVSSSTVTGGNGGQFVISSGVGGASISNSGGVGGTGGVYGFYSGTGGTSTLNQSVAGKSATGGDGGSASFVAGSGGNAVAGNGTAYYPDGATVGGTGAGFTFNSGSGGAARGGNSSRGGNGGVLNFYAGWGGATQGGVKSNITGNGGDMNFWMGSRGTSGTTKGLNGKAYFAVQEPEALSGNNLWYMLTLNGETKQSVFADGQLVINGTNRKLNAYNWTEILIIGNRTGNITVTQDGKMNFTGVSKIISNVTFSNLITLDVVVLPNCATANNGTIGRNSSGLYYCNNSAVWRQIA